MKLSIFFVFMVFCFRSVQAEDDCPLWFQASKIAPQAQDCFIQCGLIKTNMSNYMCSLRCGEFCNKTVGNCKLDEQWNVKIKTGRPISWDVKSEKEIDWSEAEKMKVRNVFSSFSSDFKDIGFEGAYRFKKSAQLGNPASSDGSSIVLYDLAFSSQYALERIIVHELGHIIFSRYKTSSMIRSYLKKSLWTLNAATDKSSVEYSTERRNFVEADGRDSPEEDFANNFEHYFFDPENLKKISPDIFNWMKEKISKKFTINKECL
jgi:hypothetical protein